MMLKTSLYNKIISGQARLTVRLDFKNNVTKHIKNINLIGRKTGIEIYFKIK